MQIQNAESLQLQQLQITQYVSWFLENRLTYWQILYTLLWMLVLQSSDPNGSVYLSELYKSADIHPGSLCKALLVLMISAISHVLLSSYHFHHTDNPDVNRKKGSVVWSFSIPLYDHHAYGWILLSDYLFPLEYVPDCNCAVPRIWQWSPHLFCLFWSVFCFVVRAL